MSNLHWIQKEQNNHTSASTQQPVQMITTYPDFKLMTFFYFFTDAPVRVLHTESGQQLLNVIPGFSLTACHTREKLKPAHLRLYS